MSSTGDPTRTLHASELDALGDASRAATGAGRTTILPRVEREGDRVRLVRDERSRYEIARLLGAGGMGEVRLAVDQDIGRQVAIKRLHQGLAGPSTVSRFVGEIRAIGQLDHPNIVPIHDVGVDEDGSLFFVMKYVDGETLESVLERLRREDPEAQRAWPNERRVLVARGVLQALEVAHANGIVHRDVKPANVMVGRFGEVVLTDWGIARLVGKPEEPLEEAAVPAGPVAVSATTRIGSLLGTPRYMSPEQLRGEHDRLDGRSDLYAVGLMLYEMLTLCHPADGARDVEDIRRIAEQDPALPVPRHQQRHPVQTAWAPADLLWLCWRLTRRDPADRPPNVAAVLDELDAIDGGRCRVQCPPTLLKRVAGESGRFVDRSPGAAIVSSLALAAIAVASAGALAVELARGLSWLAG